MLTNLFSIFDVSLPNFSPFLLAFLAVIMFVVKTPNVIKKACLNNNACFNNLMLSTITLQFSATVIEMKNFKKNLKYMSILKSVCIIFLSVLILNFFSLFPFFLSTTSHMSLNMNITMLMWMLSVLLGLTSNIKNFFAHLTPSGTPLALMSFMVLIETISNIIRPITLAVRLMANMVAGHLLLSLLSKFSMLKISYGLSSMAPLFILGLLEMGVSFIQAYVITLLCTLYIKEAFA